MRAWDDKGRGANQERRPLPETAAATVSSRPSTLKLPTHHGEGSPDAYLTQVRLATQIQGWSPGEAAVHIVLSHWILDDLLLHEQNS